MAIIKPEFGTAAQAITITLNSLAQAAARESTAWVWSDWNDILVTLKLTANAAGTIATGSVNVYAYSTVDDGITYSGAATGTDAAITLLSPSSLIFLARIFLNANSQMRNDGPFSLASVFGGTLPAKGGIVVINASGAALHTSGNSAQWQGVRSQTV